MNGWNACPVPGGARLILQDATFGVTSSPLDQTCPEKWARDSNIVNCVNVWPDYKRNYEMEGAYYDKNILVAEKMLAQAGVRIANVLSIIAATAA